VVLQRSAPVDVVEVPPVARVDELAASRAGDAAAGDSRSPLLAQAPVSGAVLAVVLGIDGSGLAVAEAEAVRVDFGMKCVSQPGSAHFRRSCIGCRRIGERNSRAGVTARALSKNRQPLTRVLFFIGRREPQSCVTLRDPQRVA